MFLFFLGLSKFVYTKYIVCKLIVMNIAEPHWWCNGWYTGLECGISWV